MTFKLYGYLLAHERTIVINSSAVTFDVDIKIDLKVLELYYDQFFEITVEFTDKLTNQLASASTQVNILQYRNQILFKGANTFKPGLPYVFQLTVKKFDGSPAAENSPILIRTSFDANEPMNQSFVLDDAGTIALEDQVPVNASSLLISVSKIY